MASSDPPETAPSWSAVSATCTITECAEPKASEFGANIKLSGSGSKHEDTRTVSCEEGYKLSGPDKIQCLADPGGSGIKFQADGDPTCTAVTCDPPSVSGGSFGTCGNKVGDTCILDCGDQKLSGSRTFSCGKDGMWDGSGTCVAPSCSAPAVAGGKTDCDGQQSVDAGATCTITCDDGSAAQGSFVCAGLSVEWSKTGVCGAGEQAYQVAFVVEITVDGDFDTNNKELTDGFCNVVADALGASPEQVECAFTVRTVRRLAAAPGRRLAAIVTVDVTATLKDKAQAESVVAKASDQAAFSAAIVEGAKNVGVTVTCVAVSKPQLAEVYIQETTAAVTTSTTTTGKKAAAEEESGSGAIIGGVVGAIAGLALLGAAFWFYSKKTSSQE